MSLLMDALRKAEEAKRSAADTAGGPAREAAATFSLELEPLKAQEIIEPTNESTAFPEIKPADFDPSPEPVAKTVAEAASPKPIQQTTAAADKPPRKVARPQPKFEEDELPAAPTPKRIEPGIKTSPVATAPAATDSPAAREAISNVFTSKHPPKSNTFAWVVGGLTLVAVAGIGGYFWWQLQPHNNNAVMPSANVTPHTPPPTPIQPVPVTELATAAPPSQTTQANTGIAETTNGNGSSSKAPQVTDQETRSSAINSGNFAGRNSEPSRNTGPIRLTPTKQPRVNPYVDQGYAALQANNLPAARQAYEKALAAEPQNSDALYGLAAIALQNNQPQAAEDYYLRALEIDPRDAVAHAGLVGLRGQSAGASAESRLKSLIAEQPTVSALHFALGNLYARQERWREAQQAYFLAYRNESGNPDIVFNLAISLDQIHQAKPAAQYYAEAIRLADSQPYGFSLAQAKKRLLELQP